MADDFRAGINFQMMVWPFCTSENPENLKKLLDFKFFQAVLQLGKTIYWLWLSNWNVGIVSHRQWAKKDLSNLGERCSLIFSRLKSPAVTLLAEMEEDSWIFYIVRRTWMLILSFFQKSSPCGFGGTRLVLSLGYETACHSSISVAYSFSAAAAAHTASYFRNGKRYLEIVFFREKHCDFLISSKLIESHLFMN